MGEAGAVSSICVGMTRMRAGLCTLVFLHTIPTLFSGGSKTQIHRLHRLHRLRIFLKIAEHQSVFYFFKKTQTQYYKTQTGRVLLNGTYLSGMQQA